MIQQNKINKKKKEMKSNQNRRLDKISMMTATPIPSPMPSGRIYLRSSGSQAGPEPVAHIGDINDDNELKILATLEIDAEKHQAEDEQDDLHPKQVQKEKRQQRSNVDGNPHNALGMGKRDLFGSMVSINEDP